MEQKILTELVGYESLVEELRISWLASLLFYIGLDLNNLLELPNDYLRKKLLDNKVEIIYYQNMQACKVFYDGDLIGEWLGPVFKLKKDEDFYYEITLESWSIEEEEDNAQS